MNIMIITERQDDVLANVSRLMRNKTSNGQTFVCIGFEGDGESALSPLFDLDRHYDLNHHVVIVVNDIRQLWQGMRELLDLVIETKDADAEGWLVNLLSGGLS